MQITLHELKSRASRAKKLYKNCRVCPWNCGIDRTSGDTGICGETSDLRIAAAVPHFGEEPVLNGKNGVGNIFISGCNLQCVYCQNFHASQAGMGDICSPEQCAEIMLKFQRDGLESVGWVTPSHHVPAMLESLAIAVERGFRLPIIYNTNSFDSIETLKLLDGVVDVYLADMRYSDDKAAEKYSSAAHYVETAQEAVTEMFRQVGAFYGEAGSDDFGGMIVRILVLPNSLAGVWESLCFVALEMSKEIPVSLMSQYRPTHEAGQHPELDRYITDMEYNEVVKMAKDLGFNTLFTQELDPEKHLMPDFSKKNPFKRSD